MNIWETKSGTSRREDPTIPSKGRGGLMPHASGKTPARDTCQAPEGGFSRQACHATLTPNGGGRSSHPGNVHTPEKAADSSASHGKRKASPRSTNRAARRRIMTARHNLSLPMTSATPTRPSPVPAPGHCLQQPSHGRQGCCTQPARPSGHPGHCPIGPGNCLPQPQATVSNDPPM